MNYYKLYHFTGALNSGSWIEIKNPVFPLSIGNYLDERLDEAYVTFFSEDENYKPTEIFKVVVNDSPTYTYYFVVGNDEATETPNGSGIYKHTLFLLEPTKLTEGILCPSLTFTNDLGQMYLDNAAQPSITVGEDTTIADEIVINNIVLDKISILPPGENSIKSPYNVYKDNKEWIDKYFITSGATLAASELQYKINNGDTNSYTETAYLLVNLSLYDIMTVTYNLYLTGGEFIQFSFLIHCLENKYPLKPYTITSMTQRVLELAEPLSGDKLIPRFNFDGVRYQGNALEGIWYTEIGSDADKYNQIRADEITITQATLREQLRAVAGLVHCEPRVKVIEETAGLLGTALKFNIVYEPYDKEEEAEALKDKEEEAEALKDKDKYKPYSFRRLNCSINEYCTEVRSNAHNLVNAIGYGKGVLVDPNNNEPGDPNAGYLAMRPEVVNERVQESNGKATTSLPIYKVIKAVCGIRYYNQGNGSNYYVQADGSIGKFLVPPTDITPYVVEKADYDLKSIYKNESTNNKKSHCIYYTQGSKNLDGLFFRATTIEIEQTYEKYAIANILSVASGMPLDEVGKLLANYPAGLFFQITYIPIYSALLSHGKQKYNAIESPFGQIYNQSENLIEAHYYGENVKGTAARLGNVEQERTYILNSIADIPKAGQSLEGYTIAATSTEILPLYIKCTLALSKDFNRINPYVGISSNKRVYEVSEREAYDRSILLKSNIVITKSSDIQMSCPYANTTAHFVEALKATKGDGKKDVPISVVYAYSKDKQDNTFAKTTLPVVASAFGNAILFTWYYKDNYSAGEQLNFITDQEITGYWAKDVPYGDYYGRVHRYAFNLLRRGIGGNGVWDSMYYYPENTLEDNEANKELISNLALVSGDILIRKDSREKLSFNLEFEFKTTEEDIIIGSGAASCCHLVDSTPSVASLRLFKGKFGKLQQTTIGMDEVPTEDEISGYSVTTDESGRSTITFPEKSSISVDYDSWAICFPTSDDERTYTDEDGDTVLSGQKIGGEIFIAGNGSVPKEPLYIVLRR